MKEEGKSLITEEEVVPTGVQLHKQRFVNDVLVFLQLVLISFQKRCREGMGNCYVWGTMERGAADIVKTNNTMCRKSSL